MKTNICLLILISLAYFSSLGKANAFYDPGTQRWLNRDPIGESGGLNVNVFVINDSINQFDTFGLENPTIGEIISDCFDCSNPKKLWDARNLAHEAQSEAIRKGYGMWNGGPGDAFRHCVWSCNMTRKVGQKCAVAIAANHEAAGNSNGQDHWDYSMDTYNNGVGRGLAGESGDCGDLCAAALKGGQLTVNQPKPPRIDVKPFRCSICNVNNPTMF